MTFDTVETSVQDASPVELFDFVTPSATFRLTSYETDYSYLGHTYSAVASMRDNIAIVDLGTDQTAVSVTIPATHALAQLCVNGVPPISLTCTITRYYPIFGFAELIRPTSPVASCTFDGDTATLRVPSGTNDALTANVASICATRHCPNFLYDSMCQVNPASFQVSTTIASISADGKTVVLAATVPATSAVPWSLHGKITHVGSGEIRTIAGEAADRKTLSVLTQFPNGTAHVGDAVIVNAGCDQLIETCAGKFSNGINHGGEPLLPPSNIFYVGLIDAKYRS